MSTWPSAETNGLRMKGWGETLGDGTWVERWGLAHRWVIIYLELPVRSSFLEPWKVPLTTLAPHWDLQGSEHGHGHTQSTLTADNDTQVVLFLSSQPFQFWFPTYMFPHETRWKQYHLCQGPLGLFSAAQWSEGYTSLHQPPLQGLASSSQAVSREASFPSFTLLDPDVRCM